MNKRICLILLALVLSSCVVSVDSSSSSKQSESTSQSTSSSSCTSSSKTSSSSQSSSSSIRPTGEQIHLTKLNGAAQKTCTTTALNFLNTFDKKDTTNNEIAEYLYQHNSKTESSSKVGQITLSWTAESSVTKPYYISIYKDEGCTDLYKEYRSYNTTIKVSNLIPQKYYYRVRDNSAEPFYSSIDSFSFSTPIRMINTGSSGGIENMRDLGGWKGLDNKSIKYGKVYRSAKWDDASDDTDVVLKDLGIKTELDVRLDSKYSTSAHPVEGINFIQNGFTDAYPYMFSNATTISNMNWFVNTFLTNENNYPFVYHCTNGADRTGLASLLIESILGVSDEDIYKDYEFTTYFTLNRIRADIIVNDDVYSFNPTGKRADFWPNNPGDGSGFMYLMVNSESALVPYFTASGKICDAVVNFLKTKCALTDQNINKIRSFLFE